MDYELIRNERSVKDDGTVEIFICLEMDDGTESYNFGYWLKSSEVAAVEADASALDAIVAKAAIKGERAFANYKINRDIPVVREEESAEDPTIN